MHVSEKLGYDIDWHMSNEVFIGKKVGKRCSWGDDLNFNIICLLNDLIPG